MKRLIVCADGTWNVRDQVDKKTKKRRPTNVTKVARTIKARAADGTSQIVGYFDGVGTAGAADKFTGGAFGDGICKNVVAIYRFLLYNYAPGDQIYLFGFSRGAFAVRSLTGLMNLVGLMDKDDDYFVPDVFALYEKGKRPGSPEWKEAFRKANVRACPPIHFIGVWDTVGALGAPGYLGRFLNGKKYSFHNVGLNSHIANAYHALAIDEHRSPFEPTMWTRPDGWKGRLEQAWFCGAHSNVGGSYKPDGIANEALHWMVEKAEALDLEFDTVALDKYEPHYLSKCFDSMTLLYRPLGVLQRKIGLHAKHGEMLHQSVIDRMNGHSGYVPKNLPMPQFLPITNTTRILRRP